MSTFRDMTDTFAPPLALLVKIGSALVHFDEGTGPDGHEFDLQAARSLLADRELAGWIESMTKKGLLPVRRR